MPSVLFLLGQMPQDPSSGAARSMRLVAEMLVREGYDVRGLATTATELGATVPALALLRGLGHRVRVDRRAAVGKRGRPTYTFADGGIEYTLLDVGTIKPRAWRGDHARTFDQLFRREIDRAVPDFLFTFGGFPDDVERRRLARERGAAVVFGLRNMKYMDRAFFSHIDAVLTPSEFISSQYARRIGLLSTPLPTPLDLEETLAPEQERIHYTFVNPVRAKGVVFYAALAERLAVERPDIPLLVIEARGTGRTLLEAGRAGGFDLARHASLKIVPSVPKPRDIYRTSRVLLVPSVVEEAAGRVAAEALVNGIPPIVSDRGGLPENCRGGGFVEPIPPDVTTETSVPPGPEAVTGWFDRVAALADDPAEYERACTRAREAGAAFLPETLAPRYRAWFGSLGRAGGVLRA